MLLIQLNLNKAATLGVLASGHLTEVGYSMGLRHKLARHKDKDKDNLQQKHLFILKQTHDRSNIIVSHVQLVVTF